MNVRNGCALLAVILAFGHATPIVNINSNQAMTQDASALLVPAKMQSIPLLDFFVEEDAEDHRVASYAVWRISDETQDTDHAPAPLDI